jgi:hypothetical protein
MSYQTQQPGYYQTPPPGQPYPPPQQPVCTIPNRFESCSPRRGTVANTCNHRCTTPPRPPHQRPNPRRTGDVWQLGEFLHLRGNWMTTNAMDTVWRRCAAVGYAERRASAVLIVLIVAVKHSNGLHTTQFRYRYTNAFVTFSLFVGSRRYMHNWKKGGTWYRRYTFNNLLPSTLAKR